jgi:PAS domain S-box-containing protein
MDYTEKTREELIKELLEFKQSTDSVKEQYEKEISTLRMAWEKVSKSEEKFRKAYMTSPDSININRLSDGMYVSINEGFTKIMGYTEAEVVGKTSLELNIWDDPKNRMNLIRELQEKGRVENFEAVFRKKDGGVVNGLMSATLIDLEGVPHILSVSRDITIRKKAEEALAQEKYLMETIMNNLPDHIYFKDRESRFIRINNDHARSFGLSDPSEAVGKTDFDFFTEEHARQAYDDEQKIIQTGQMLHREEKLTRPDRPDTWSSTTKLPMLDKEGQIIGTFGISRDITEQKRSAEQLFLLANALRSISECVSITDLNDKVLFLNESFLKTYGYEEDELKGKIISIIGSPDNPPELINGILPATKKGGWHGELLNRRKDGSEFPVFLSTAVIKNDLQQPVALIGVANDITKRKKAEEEIILKNELLQVINAEKDKFFSIIAHDLRGPLSAFVDATQILTEEIQSMTLDEIRDITISMKTSASNIYGLLENLLEWSRLRRNVMDFVPERLNLKEKIEACIDVLSESARKKKIELTFSIPGELEVLADNHMFDTVIRNLLSNAIKFTRAGGKVIVTAKFNNDHSIEVEISDSGIGMTQELKNKLFHINEKTSRPGTEGEMSTGLGLLLCKEFIEKNGGKIWVESEVGKGSVFSFTVPERVRSKE